MLKSSNFSIWPFVIKELPFSENTKGQNMLFAGLWFGDTKPFMLTFLQPFHSSLQKLKTKGTPIKVKAADDSTEMVSKVILPAATCDMPVKGLVCNAVQYSRSYGCFKCKLRSVTVKVSAQGQVHAFSLIQPDPDGPKRSHLETLQDVNTEVKSSEAVDGINRPSWFEDF